MVLEAPRAYFVPASLAFSRLHNSAANGYAALVAVVPKDFRVSDGGSQFKALRVDAQNATVLYVSELMQCRFLVASTTHLVERAAREKGRIWRLIIADYAQLVVIVVTIDDTTATFLFVAAILLGVVCLLGRG